MKMTLMILSLLLLPYSIKAKEESEVIKSKDLKNSELDPMSTSGNSNASITPAQVEELKKQLEKLKESQKKSQELLDELDKE